jgi:hypothetical protein
MGTGLFAMLWLVARASVQSVTIDEADTYLYFVRRADLTHWRPNANNHVLNSILMRLFTSIFGASTLTLRLPALIGAALYIAAAYLLVRLLSRRPWLQWALFVCLTCSPFVMDYLVAARGYGLASAFLLGAVTIAVWHQSQDEAARAAGLRRTCAWISVSAALCLCANFAFAIADALTAAGLFLWICREHRRDLRKLLPSIVLPGLAVAYFFVGSVLLSWPKGQFTWGSTSMLQTVRSLVSSSLYEPNHFLLNPRLHHYFVHFGTFLYPLLAALVLWRIVLLLVSRTPSALTAICGAALVIALACHQILYWTSGILLPLDRTAMWVVLLFLVMAGALAAVPLTSKAGRISERALTAILVLIACYNLGALRLNYFNEWKYDAEIKNVYGMLADYHQTYGLTKVSANWRYVSSLNCYRAMSGHQTIDEIPNAPSVTNFYPAGFQAYVFFYPWDEDFAKREGLNVVFHDSATGIALGIRPEAMRKEGNP